MNAIYELPPSLLECYIRGKKEGVWDEDEYPFSFLNESTLVTVRANGEKLSIYGFSFFGITEHAAAFELEKKWEEDLLQLQKTKKEGQNDGGVVIRCAGTG